MVSVRSNVYTNPKRLPNLRQSSDSVARRVVQRQGRKTAAGLFVKHHPKKDQG